MNETDAKILAFPGIADGSTEGTETAEAQRTCDLCVHCASSQMLGEYCMLYEESLLSVHVAASCDDFETV